MNYQNAIQSLDQLIHGFNTLMLHNRNEATTRFQLIDSLLKDVFCWEVTDISCEDSYDGQYSDYTLKLLRPVAIVEAKKEGTYFEIPNGLKENIISLKILLRGNSLLESAIMQVSRYCQARGVSIGIVTNGWQMIAFVANRTDSVPPMDGNAIFFKSLAELQSNFPKFWNALSKNAFESNDLQRLLTGNVLPDLPPKLSSSINGYPGIKNRNPFQNELQIISDLVLEDVINEEEIEKTFLEQCYCKSGALSSYSLVSKDILSTRYHYLFDENDHKADLIPITTKRGLSQEFLDSLGRSISKRPILLIGDVGVGKSTFIKNLLKVEAPQEIEKSLSFTIDLGSEAIFTFDLKQAILEELKIQLKDNYKIDIEEDNFVRACYYVDLEDFKKSVHVKPLYNIDPTAAMIKEVSFLSAKVVNQTTHLKRSLEYLYRNQKKQIIIFIDNCDQRFDKDQEEAFLVAQEFASSWSTLVFLSLRPETFHRIKKSTHALSGYHTKAFVIPPPRVDEVLLKRIEFAQKITGGKIKLSKLTNTTTFSNLHQLLQSLKISINENEDLIRFIDNISNGNIRSAVELLKIFFGSGHVFTEKIVDIQKNTGFYLIPLHEFLRGVIYGDNSFYNPSSSPISNIFDVHRNDLREHFIVPILLSTLNNYVNQSKDNGFIKISEVYSLLQSNSYTSEQIDYAINFCYSKKLIETSEKGNEILQDENGIMLRITPQGAYHVVNLCTQFVYFDAIVVDTPIFLEDFRTKITACLDIHDRLNRGKIFIEYLDQQWKNLNLNNSHFNWMQKSEATKKNISAITFSLHQRESRNAV